MSGILRGWRRGVAFAAVTALVFHALLLLVHAPASAAYAQNGETSVVICTALGLKSVPLSQLGGTAAPDEAPVKSDALPYCPVCLGAQIASFALAPTQTVLAVPVPQKVLVSHSPHVAARAGELHLAAHAPRAPPAFS